MIFRWRYIESLVQPKYPIPIFNPRNALNLCRNCWSCTEMLKIEVEIKMGDVQPISAVGGRGRGVVRV